MIIPGGLLGCLFLVTTCAATGMARLAHGNSYSLKPVHSRQFVGRVTHSNLVAKRVPLEVASSRLIDKRKKDYDYEDDEDEGKAEGGHEDEEEEEMNGFSHDDEDEGGKEDATSNWDDEGADEQSDDREASDEGETFPSSSKPTHSGSSGNEDKHSAKHGMSTSHTLAAPKTSKASKASPAKVCSAMSMMYDEMGGSGWKRQDSWMGSNAFARTRDSSCCSWYGVTCAGSRPIGLELVNNGLSGAISSALFELVGLTKLNLTSNSIEGSLPDLFGSLPDLRLLALDHNNLGGPLPPSLLSSTSLATLHLSNNNFTGQANFSGMANLVNLVISHNAFEEISLSDRLPLQRVMINDNVLKGQLPTMSGMAGLKVFNAARNKLAGPIFDLSGLKNLTNFDVRSNRLTGDFPDSITALEALQSYHISYNQLSGTFPSSMTPPSLISCSALPNNIQMCPPQEISDNPQSLSARCKVSCKPAKPKAETGGGGVASSGPHGSIEEDSGETKASDERSTGDSNPKPNNGMDAAYNPSLLPQANRQTPFIDPATDPNLRYSVNESRRLFNVPTLWITVTLSVTLLSI